MWGLHPDRIEGVCKGTFPGRLVVLLYTVLSLACVQYRWPCVSLKEKELLGRPLVWGLEIHLKLSLVKKILIYSDSNLVTQSINWSVSQSPQ